MSKYTYEEQESCDKYDYLAAAFCGGMAGLIDILFVGRVLWAPSVTKRQMRL